MPSIVVTGASRGIGLAIARRLSASGHSVIAIARHDSDELRAAVSRAKESATGSLAFRAFDLGDLAAIPRLAKELRAEAGAISGLVNNAALGLGGVLATMPDSQIERLVSLNTVSPMLLTKYILRGMLADGAGRIINIASIVASTGYSGLSVYSATKASVVGFTQSLAREVGPLGITVNAIAPGFLDTAMTDELGPKERDQIVRRSALRRLADVTDIAAAVEFLLGEGGRNITGTVLTVDAGSTA